ncbi:MAG: cytochrome c peroxidase [Nevskiales bacterium]|nr:cytochrome c peroxidase [Nevskiales bacterium]
MSKTTYVRRGAPGGRLPMITGLSLALAACGGGGGSDPAVAADAQTMTAAPSPLDTQLRERIDALQLSAQPAAGVAVPDIDAPLPQLGMRLFFSRSLGGDLDSACVSCHHPDLAGADALALSIGVGAIDPALLGPGRAAADGVVRVPRNAPTTFNVALMDDALFLDGRVESLNVTPGSNGAGTPIRTPDSAFGAADPDAGDTLTAAQARFPVTSTDEMLGHLLPGADRDTVRSRLAQRIGDYGEGAGELAPNRWLPLFEHAFGVADAPEALVTYANIATALAAYERSQLFVDTPWHAYVGGATDAIPAAAKRGALLFLTPLADGGAGCSGCHRGDLFTDQNFHTAVFPQIGPGKGDGDTGDDDFGRARETGDDADRYAFRTPSLLNVALTAPYGHAGAYATLTDVVRHYRDPQRSVHDFIDRAGWCRLPPFSDMRRDDCAALYPNARANNDAALAKLDADRAAGRRALQPVPLSDGQVADIVAFLQTLTDACAADPDCIGRWIPPRDGGPDGQQVDAIDIHGSPL